MKEIEMPDIGGNDGSMTAVFARMQAADESAAKRLLAQFLPRLLGLARKTLRGLPHRVADPEDAVQSAVLSFWRNHQQGRYPEAMHRDALWGLLARITVREARRQIRRERTVRRKTKLIRLIWQPIVDDGVPR